MKVIIDGNNILRYGKEYNLIEYGTEWCVPQITALIAALDAHGIEWHCFFDANCMFKIKETCSKEHFEDFKSLLKANHKKFSVVPGGTKADPWILDMADDEGLKIITNDLYRDAEYQAKHPWLQREYVNRAAQPHLSRLIPFMFVNNQLRIPALNVRWDIVNGCEVKRRIGSTSCSGNDDALVKAVKETNEEILEGIRERQNEAEKVRHDSNEGLRRASEDQRDERFETVQADSEIDWGNIGGSLNTPWWVAALGIGCLVVGGAIAVKKTVDDYGVIEA